MTGLAAVVAFGLATLPDDFKGRRNPELLADGSDLASVSPASSSSPISMESLPWTLRTRAPERARFRGRSSRTGETSKLLRYLGVPDVSWYSLSHILRQELRFPDVHGIFPIYTDILP